MHIKDLHIDIELDSAALSAVRGGSSMYAPTAPERPAFPTFGGDWGTFSNDLKGYIGDIKTGAGFPDIEMPAPSVPEVPVIGADPLAPF